jgi:hypothetical protein
MTIADSFLSLVAGEYNAASAVWQPHTATHHATTAAATATHAAHRAAAPKVNMSTASILVISLPDGYTPERLGVSIPKAKADANTKILNKACKKAFHDYGVNPKCKSVDKGKLQAAVSVPIASLFHLPVYQTLFTPFQCPQGDQLCYCALTHCPGLANSQILVGYPDPTFGAGHITKHALPKGWKSHEDSDDL